MQKHEENCLRRKSIHIECDCSAQVGIGRDKMETAKALAEKMSPFELMSFMNYIESMQRKRYAPTTAGPCGEIPLGGGGICVIGSEE